MKRMPILLMLLLLSFVPGATANDSPEALQEAFMAALRSNDAAGLAALYAPDAVNFPVDSMMGVGPDAVREDWEHFFSEFVVTDASLSNSHLETHGDTAVAWGLFTVVAKPVGGGEAVELNGRYMDVSRRIDGRWVYVADHASVPLNGGQSE